MKSVQVNKDIPRKLKKSDNLFPVVGIGASAGGLEAFKKLLKAVPRDSGMAFVLVQHLDPNHESLLRELLQKITPIPVLEITDEIHVEPNHIYIIPINKMLIANNGVLELSPRLKKNGNNKANLPINLFFSSLAEVHQAHAIGIVLSGTASDGTLGLQTIKERGGITFAQDGDSAAYAEMPNSAVDAGVVDFVLAPELMPQKLLEVTRESDRSGTESIESEKDVFNRILALICETKGTDFTHYKKTTIHRRIHRRMAMHKVSNPVAYLELLNEDKSEVDLLYTDLLIPVTTFFRDAKVFKDLRTTIFPNIIKNKNEREHIRIWVAGCSTGEEVFSIACLFYDFLGEQLTQEDFVKIQIFGTDISKASIAKARAGLYSANDVKELSEHQLKRYFTKNKDKYEVIKAIRNICVFAAHDFLSDPPFGHMDFISCRNVLIYMEPYLQKKALNAFHYALIPEGYLLLGKSESISLVPGLFSTYKKNERLFSKKESNSRFLSGKGFVYERSRNPLNDGLDNPSNKSNFLKIANDIMLSNFTPASVIINESMDILHFRGNTGKYLEPAAGNASLNVLRMAKQGLAFELRSMLHKVKKEKKAIFKKNVPLYTTYSEEDQGNFLSVDVEVIPLPNVPEPYYLIVFQENPFVIKPLAKEATENGLDYSTSRERGKKDERDARIESLNLELMQLRQDIRVITDDQEYVNQELQSNNEELLSSNEEMQSLNEEIETSKEELQSTFEELMVVNQETIGLNEQLTDAKDYAEAIVETIHEPLIVLDKKFKVKSANKAFLKFFKIDDKQEVEGKSFYAIDDKQWDIPALQKLLENVLQQKSGFEDYEINRNFPRIGNRNMLLTAREILGKTTEENLILLALVDITEKLKLQQKEKEELESFKNLLLQAPVAIMLLKVGNYEVEVANEAYLKIMEKDIAFIGTHLFESLPELEAQGIHLLLDKVVKTEKPMNSVEVEIPIIRNGKNIKGFYNFVYHPLANENGKIFEIIVVANDVTEQVLSRKKIEETELKYHNMIYSSPSLIAIFKGENMIIEIANDAILDSWGKGKHVIGKSVFEVVPEIVKQGYDKFLLQVYNSGETFHAHEMPIVLERNGKPEQMHYTFVFQAQRNKEGTIEGVAVISNEVSEQVLLNKKLKESESHFRLMADLMPAKVNNAHANGNSFYFNKDWLDFTGLTFDELKDLGYQKIVHPEDLKEFQKRFLKASEEGVDLTMEMRLINKDNVAIWHLNRYSPVKGKYGNILMWVGVSSDISEQMATRNRNLATYETYSKNLEVLVEQRTAELQIAYKGLLEKNDELIRMNMELEAFAYVSSHDLQEPLRKIQIFSGRIFEREQENLTDKSKLYFKHIKSSVDRMQTLIKDLYVFSHLSKSERKFEDTNMNTIVDDVKKILSEEIADKQAVIEVDVNCKVRVIVFQFHQLMVNLISNSLKFSRPGVPLQIKINGRAMQKNHASIKGLSHAKAYYHISFSDNGIGFEQEYSERIFEVFQKLHGREEFSGTGIGLAIVKKIMENHNGIIIATSEINRGATFDMYLPTK